MKRLSNILFVVIAGLAFCSSASIGGESASFDQTENIRERITESEIIVDICVYEMEWIPASAESWKAEWVSRAVVTGVHKGSIPVGTKVEYSNMIEDPPKLFKKGFRAVVEGELYTLFFSSDEAMLKDGRYTLDAPFNFERGKGDFSEAFEKEINTNPDLNKNSEQGGTVQPATLPELKSEGADKPQPEADARPR